MSKNLKVIILCAALVAIAALVYSFSGSGETSGSAVGGDQSDTPPAAKSSRGGMQLQEKYGFAPTGD
ncbi:MAG TPA: hypothetical protein VMZ31_13375 [Phycisphaerae bacterium]|nr:hypothetical protein [Phycisphaerae bacterium]